MSETTGFGFGQFVPGFDFLQNLSKTASQAQPAATGAMPGMASWVAPTLSIEEIDKRIQELKSVQFWLEQNATALKATIQAMEVQKMTLSTLQSMNVNMADLAKAFTAKPPVTEPATPAPKASLFTPAPAPVAQPEPALQPATQPAPESPVPPQAKAADQELPKPAVDPMHWWGALTQQFQGIASAALKDVAAEAMKAGMTAKNAKTTVKASASGKTASGKTTAATSGRKPAAKKSSASSAAKPRKTASAAPRKTAKK